MLSLKIILVLGLIFGLWANASAQYQYQKENVTIVRDSFGIPHIYGVSDADAAYGLAWAHCEDAFEWIQYNLLGARGQLGAVKGKDGVVFDFALQMFGIDTLVENRYEKDLSPDYRKVVEAYTQGVNDYALKFPQEVLFKKAFPIRPQDVIKGYVLIGLLLGGAGTDLLALHHNKLQEISCINERGSNAMAIAPHRTEDGKTWLLINSHQPIEGEFAWYEAHINSEQGWNAMGGLFPGGTSIFVGCNEHLGWAHTNNYHNFGDVYRLRVSKGKRYYLYDKKWRKFQYKTAKFKVKWAGIKLPIRRKIPICEYGPVFKTKHGWYALRYPAANDIRAAEQWYVMNKATNFKEFETAVKMQALPLFNIIYADRVGNIYFVSEGMIPKRDSSISWSRPVHGVSSQYKWNQLLSYDEKIKYFNPQSGFVYNCNGTPLKATGYSENSRDYFVGLQLFEANRNERFGKLLNEHQGKFQWSDFEYIKYDKSYDSVGTYAQNFKAMYQLNAEKYPKLRAEIEHLKQWNWVGDSSNTHAALAMMTHEYLSHETKLPFAFMTVDEQPVEEKAVVKALGRAAQRLKRIFGTFKIPLGRVQKLSRGETNFPIGGLSEVSRAVEVKYDKKHKFFRMYSGDGYMQMTKFSAESVEIQAIAPFGSSAHPNSPHYTDQMELFVKEKTRTMTLDKEKVFKTAKRVYHPQE